MRPRHVLTRKVFVHQLWRGCAVFVLIDALLIGTRAAAIDAPPEFEKDIRTLLSEHCFRCHGPDKQGAGLRLDVKRDALVVGEDDKPTAILPGDPENSTIL